MAAKARKKKKTRKPQGTSRRTSGTFKPSSREEAQANKASWSDYWSSAAKGYKEEYVMEREMTAAETKKEKELKRKYDDSGMKASMIKQYGPVKGPKVYFATIRGKAMREELDYEDVYSYILETLVSEDYAADYESAEVMFENISTEFTAVLLEQYLEEAKRSRAARRAANAGKKGYDAKGNPTTKKGPVRAYDVDETLFGHGKKGKPNVQVHVNDASGNRVKSLSNQEFNTHKLEPGHSYDFSEFQSAKKFRETSSPNKRVIKKLRKQLRNRQNVHLITARSKFDNPHEFHAHLQRHGINIPMRNVHYTGGMKGGDVGKKKVDVGNAVAQQSGTKNIHMYDDAKKVHTAFEREKQEHPTTKKIKTHMVAPDSSGEPRVRSYQATKGGSTGGPAKTIQQNQRAAKRAKRGMRAEMTSYEYWKQFLDEANRTRGERIRFHTAYHGTSVPNARKIRRGGFRAGTRFAQDMPLSSGERIYVTKSREKASNYADQAGPEKYGMEMSSDNTEHRRSPINLQQIKVDRSRPGEGGFRYHTSDVGRIGKLVNYVTRRNKPEIMKLRVADRVADPSDDMERTKTSEPDEFTISKRQADTALRNAQTFDKRPIIRKPQRAG